MKEATGELSMTAIVVVILGILAVSLPLIINTVVKTMERNANCSAAFGCDNTVCKDQGGSATVMTCYYVPDKTDTKAGTVAGQEKQITCPCSSTNLN